MVQFYLLSVMLNIVAGYALISVDAKPRQTNFDHIREFLKNGTTRLLIGVFCIAVAFFKLLTVMRGDMPVIGDFFPASAGMAAGFTLLLEFYLSNSSVASDVIKKLDKIFVANRRVVGVISIISGLSHFLFANIIFL